MSLWLASALVVAGAVLVVAFAGVLVRGVVATSHGFGISSFLISVIFLGFDAENLAVGAVGSHENVAGIALGSIVGAAMVALALAFGITALVAPMRFERVRGEILCVPVAAVSLFGLLALDGELSRFDGAVLLCTYALAVGYLVWLSRRGIDVEAATKAREPSVGGRWKAATLTIVALVAIVVGAELLVVGSKPIIERLGLSGTFYGMVIVALVVSIEEVARELPAAWRGRPEISVGNVFGSVLAFFLFNAGVIALVEPVPVGIPILRFYLPVAVLSVVVVSMFVWRRRVPRWAGGLLVALYALFVVGGYVLDGKNGLVPS